MPPKEALDHRRTHNLLLISRLLNQRDTASPFTLILDSISQSAKPLLNEYISRATSSNSKIIYVSFSTFRPPRNATTIITARHKQTSDLQREILRAIPTGGAAKTLLIIDSLNRLCSSSPKALAPFLSSLLSPTTTLLGVYHIDVPLCLPAEGSAHAYPDSAPHPLTLLKYFCTTLITVHSITHMLAEKRAKDRSLAPPTFGMEEGVEGLVVGFGSNPKVGMVLEMEYRRKSGRGVVEWFYLPFDGKAGPRGEKVILLEDHPEWRASEVVGKRAEEEGEGEEPTSTFELGLTERQKKARDEVVLPYFDAQRAEGIGGGGAILFTPDKDIDDFDDEEDET